MGVTGASSMGPADHLRNVDGAVTVSEMKRTQHIKLLLTVMR